MPRTQRLKVNNETAVYHVMSRTALDGFPLGDVEKDFMLDLIRRYSALYLVEILGFCLMGNHFHILVRIVSRAQIYRPGYSKTLCRIFMVMSIFLQKAWYPHCGRNYQVFLSLCVKSRSVLQGIYNRRHNRRGLLLGRSL